MTDLSWFKALPGAVTMTNEGGVIEGQFSGLVELGLDLPDDIPHFNRDKK